jgi:hydroxypyruvate isomerase
LGKERTRHGGFTWTRERVSGCDRQGAGIRCCFRLSAYSRHVLFETYEKNLAFAANEAAKMGRNVIIEPINTRNVPGYFLNRQAEARRFVDAVGLPNLLVQMDLYHVQIVEGDVATKIRKFIDKVDHFQIAGVPERHEPDIGEVNYPYLFELIDELGFEGWIGCEYNPHGDTSAGLGWARTYLG